MIVFEVLWNISLEIFGFMYLFSGNLVIFFIILNLEVLVMMAYSLDWFIDREYVLIFLFVSMVLMM